MYALLTNRSYLIVLEHRLSSNPGIGQNQPMSDVLHESSQSSVSASLPQAVLHAASLLGLDRQALLSVCNLTDQQLADPPSASSRPSGTCWTRACSTRNPACWVQMTMPLLDDFRLLGAQFRHAAPADLAPCQNVFACPLQFASDD